MTRLVPALLALALALPVTALAQTPAEKGREIAERGAERAEGYSDSLAAGEMILRDAGGQESRRRFRSSSLEMADDGDRTLMVFEWPGDIEGTALLTHAHAEGDDDQWLYLPALKRVKRISSSNKSGSFVGSEFSYEDLVPAEVEKFTYLWLRDEPCPTDPALACHVYERHALDQSSGYSREVIWRDQDAYRIQRADYYDRRDALLKTLTADGYQLYDGQFWRPDSMLMQNLLTGKSTLMLWSDYRFSTGLTERDFTTRALERSR
ncbi:MAG: outer membrane lipoprotein-sorting protein [Geminicoccaceae bacterium]